MAWCSIGKVSYISFFIVLLYALLYYPIYAAPCYYHNARALSSNPAGVAIKNTIGEEGNGNHVIKSNFLEKTLSPVSAFCYARYLVYGANAISFTKLILSFQDSSVVRLSRIDPMVSGSNPPSAKLSSEWRELPALCNSSRRNHKVWSHREGWPRNCSIKEKLISVH